MYDALRINVETTLKLKQRVCVDVPSNLPLPWRFLLLWDAVRLMLRGKIICEAVGVQRAQLRHCCRNTLVRLRRKLPKAFVSSMAKPWRHRKQIILHRAFAKVHLQAGSSSFQGVINERHSDNGSDFKGASPRNCACVALTGATLIFATLSTTTPQKKTTR